MEKKTKAEKQKPALEKLQDYFSSEQFKIDMEESNRCLDIQHKRYERFQQWVQTIDFDKFMERIIKEHDDAYISKCYKKKF